MNVAELCGHRKDPRTYAKSRSLVSDTLVGVEVEMENAQEIGSTYWSATGDGSLRDNGVEYVLQQPLTGSDLMRAMDELTHLVEDNFTPTFGERTSTHIHVDVRDLDKDQLMSYVLLYMALEVPLFKYCGADRESSNFCPSYRLADSQLKTINTLICTTGENTTVRNIHNAERYAGCNINSVGKFGSLEFRGHRGEYRKEPLLRWINMLLALKEKAKDTDYNTIPYIGRKGGIDKFVVDIFGDELYGKLRYRGMYKDVSEGFRLVERTLNLHKLPLAMRKERGMEMSESFKEYIEKTKGSDFEVAKKRVRPKSNEEILEVYRRQMAGTVRARPAPPMPTPSGEWFSNRIVVDDMLEEGEE